MRRVLWINLANVLFLLSLMALQVSCGGADPGSGLDSSTIGTDAADTADVSTVQQEQFPLSWKLESGFRVEKWTESSKVHVPLAPDVRQMADGTYRMYFVIPGEGVGSATSVDGLSWTREPGVRVKSDRQDGVLGFDRSHPWLVKLSDGRWRMYIQANTGINTPAQITSAISDDGFTFVLEEGIRMSIGSGTGLSYAGHGRSWRQEGNSDWTWGMVFSGNLLNDTNASDIMLATSIDGLTWTLVNTSLFNNGHDPALITLTDGRLAVVFAYLKESLRTAVTSDGLSWSDAQVLTLFNEANQPQTEIWGDVALMRLQDGSLRMFSNHPNGIVSFVPTK